MQRQLAPARTGRKPLRIALSTALLAGVFALSPASPLSVSPASAADVWTVPVDLSGASQLTTLPQVSSDSTGRSVAVWLRATVNDQTDPVLCDSGGLDKCVVDAAQFDPIAGTWSAPQTLSSAAESATQADVIINGAGEAMAIWRRTSGAGTVIQSSLFNGTTWAAPNDLSVTTGSPRGPQVSVSPSGVFTVVWYRSLNATTNAVESRQFSAPTWTPALASPADQLSLGVNENAELSRVVADSTGHVIAMWQGQLVVDGPFFVRASRLTAGTWSAPVSVSSGFTLIDGDAFQNTLAPQLAVDAAGNGTAVWHQWDGVNTRIYTSRYTAGGTWSAPVVLSAALGNALNARVESDSAGNVTALWRRFDAPLPKGHSIIQTSRYSIATGTWSTPLDLSSPGRESQSQRLAVDPAGNVTAVWRRNNADGNSIIQSARFSPTAGVWSAARDLSAPGVSAFSPSTDVDQSGDVIVVWARGNIIQASRSTEEAIPGFVSVTPVRIFDTRPGESPNALRLVDKVKVGGAYTLKVQVSALPGGITPATGIGAVSMNVTVTDPNADGFLTVYPCGQISEVSNVNFVRGQTVANAVIAPVSADGSVCFFSNTPTHVLADLNGYFPTGSGYTAVGPKRVLDTRPGESPNALLTGVKAKIGGTTELVAKMTSLPGATTPASGVGAVSLNVAVSNPEGPGFVTVYPCHDRTLVSSVNFVAGQTVANAVIAPVSDAGDVCFFSNVNADIIVDISGWFPTESGYAPAESPARVLDTRPGESPNALRDVSKTKIGGTKVLTVHMANLTDVTPPVGVAAVALNVTATNPVASGFITVYPCGALQEVSSVNFVAGQTVANAVIAPLSAAGDLCFYSNVDTDLVVDINGFFAI